MIRAAFLAACFLATTPNPPCTCVLGGVYDYGDPGYSDPADCAKHGAETE